MDALEKNGSDQIPVLQTEQVVAMSESLQRFRDIVNQSPDNRLLRDL